MGQLRRTIRVLVVDDHEVVRAGVTAVLSKSDGIDVVATAGSGAEALRLFDDLRPDVVILDHRLPDLTGASVCQEMVAQRPGCSVIILTSFDTDEVIHACLVAGARGYLTKNVVNGDLAAAVIAVSQGDVYLAPEITQRVIEWARAAKHLYHADWALVPDEVEVLGLVAQGMSNRQIAFELCVSESTVKARLKAAMKKLGASRRLDAVAAGMRRGVI